MRSLAPGVLPLRLIRRSETALASAGAAKQPDRAELARSLRWANPLLPSAVVDAEVDLALDRRGPYGPIAGLLADQTVTEVLINGPGKVWVERAGELVCSSIEVGPYELDLLIERILTPLGLRVDRSSPIVDARLVDGSRVNVVVPPLSIGGPALSIRRFSSAPIPLADFGPTSMVEVLTSLVVARASILIIGPTSSGKTTLINTLSGLVDRGDRIVCIEDTAELRLDVPNLVRLEARPANSEGAGEVPLGDLVRTALRMRPDRLIVGEVRGAEAFDLLLALTGGHRGCFATCHGANTDAGLRRLETLAAMAGSALSVERLRTLIGDGLDAVVVVERLPGGTRRVASISELRQDQARLIWAADDLAGLRGAPVERLRAS